MNLGPVCIEICFYFQAWSGSVQDRLPEQTTDNGKKTKQTKTE